MLAQSPSYKRYLQNRQNEIDAEKFRESQKLSLFNEKTFYQAFTKDMLNARREVIIYSPFISKYRSEFFRRSFETLRKRNISVFVFTRPLEEHDYFMRAEIKCALKDYENYGACVVYLSGLIHEKVAVIDREILWEGSLNILSQRESKEMMRRIVDEDAALQVVSYLKLKKPLAENYKNQYERLCRNLVENTRCEHKLKIRIFAMGVIIPVITWWLFLGFRVMMLSLKGIKSVASIINYCINKESKSMSKINSSDFEIQEPSEKEIEETIEKIKEKENVVLSKDDAIKYFKLYKELGQWFLMEKNLDSPDSIADEMGEEMKDILRRKRGQELDIYDAQAISKESLNVIISREKERIREEIKGLIDKNKRSHN